MTTFDLEVRAPVVSRFVLDGGAMFGVVPRALWSREHRPDDEGRIELVARVLVVGNRQSGDRVLIDTGLGQRWRDEERARLGIARGPDLAGALAADGIDPETITHVVVTHFHWDHAGGLFAGDDPDARALALPRARILSSSSAASGGERPSPRTRASFHAGDVAVLVRERAIEFVSALDPWPLPFVDCLRQTDAHASGMLMPVIAESRDLPRVMVPSDVLPTFGHAKASWTSAFDDHPGEVVAAKQRLFETAHRDRALIHLGHDPRVEAATVGLEDDQLALRHATFSRPLAGGGPRAGATS